MQLNFEYFISSKVHYKQKVIPEINDHVSAHRTAFLKKLKTPQLIQKLYLLLWNPKVHYHAQESVPMDSELNPAHHTQFAEIFLILSSHL
jgi:hypothetical protein